MTPEYTPVMRGFDQWRGYYTGELGAPPPRQPAIPARRPLAPCRPPHAGNVEYWNHASPCWHCGNFTAVDNSFATALHPEPTPHFDDAGVYSTNLYSGWVEDVLDAHRAEDPLFLYLPFEAVHGAASCEPDCNDPSGDLLQAPGFFIDQQRQVKLKDRRTFAGMLGALDSAVANITAKLKAKGMWE